MKTLSMSLKIIWRKSETQSGMRTFLFFHDNDVNLITVNLLSWNLYLREGGL